MFVCGANKILIDWLIDWYMSTPSTYTFYHIAHSKCADTTITNNQVKSLSAYTHQTAAYNYMMLQSDDSWANLPTMNLAFWIAARVVSTLGPSVQKPWLSGGLTCINATSRFNILRRNNKGTSLRKIGVKSARPSLTGLRQLAPMNSEFDLKMPTNNSKVDRILPTSIT